MTKHGFELLLFFVALFMAFFSILFSPGRESVEMRLERPKVEISNPCWNVIRNIAGDFERTRMIYELVKMGGFLSKSGAVVEKANKDEVLLKMTKFGVEYEFTDDKTIRVKNFGIVVILK